MFRLVFFSPQHGKSIVKRVACAGPVCTSVFAVTVSFARFPTDPHSASEALIWGSSWREAGERSQEPAEDVPHHVHSSGTARLYVLAHLPPHQIKAATHRHAVASLENGLSCLHVISAHFKSTIKKKLQTQRLNHPWSRTRSNKTVEEATQHYLFSHSTALLLGLPFYIEHFNVCRNLLQIFCVITSNYVFLNINIYVCLWIVKLSSQVSFLVRLSSDTFLANRRKAH